MPTYEYKAISNHGKRIQGYYYANSEKEVANMLRHNDYLPIFIKEVDTGKDKAFLTRKVGKKDLAIFCNQFFTMVNAGINIMETLNILRGETENIGLKNALDIVYEDLQKGLSLSQALERQGRVFPSLFINMVKVGEISGNLDMIMKNMATHYENEYDIETKVKNALTYPLILIFVSITVITFLLIYVLPTFVSIFNDNNSILPMPTRILLKTSNVITDYWYRILILLISILVGLIVFNKSKKGRKFFHNLILNVPGFKNIYIKVLSARFAGTMSILLSSGIPLLEALDMAGQVVRNEVISSKVHLAKNNISKGIHISAALEELKIFPPMVHSMVKIGEESGSLDHILNTLSDFYNREVKGSIERMTTLLEPILIIIMAVIVGFIVIAIALPMFDLINTMDF